MHLYRNNKRRVASDRPQGINIPGGSRRIIKCVSGDTLTFTALVYVPSTHEPVRRDDLETTIVYVALAENRFTPVLWSGSSLDGWVVLDEHRHGLVHITIPRTVMNVLRRGSYAFSVVVDDGIVRETQLTGNLQIEYEPTGSINDIPYRRPAGSFAPISLTPEVDLSAQDYSRLTYDQLVEAVDAVALKIVGSDRGFLGDMHGSDDYDPTEAELEADVARLSRFIVANDELRAKAVVVVKREFDSETFSEFVERVRALLKITGLGTGGGA